MEATEKLSKYGTVKTCKVIKNNVVTIVVTNGFKEMKSFDFLQECSELFQKYEIIETAITENNFAMVVLSKKQ